jgi:putative ABC transport system permease protein
MLTGMRFHVVADQNARMNAVVNYTILVLLVGYAAIAIVNTLAMAAAARVPEFALLRLVGATRAQVRRMMRWETLLVVVFGALLGSVISAATLMAFSYGLTGSIVPVVPLWQYGLVLGIAALLGFAANMLPMRLALRVTPIQAVDMGE